MVLQGKVFVLAYYEPSNIPQARTELMHEYLVDIAMQLDKETIPGLIGLTGWLY